MTNWDEIRFDMSRNGLIELSAILEHHFVYDLSDELKNFANEIRNMVERAPEVKESSWLDV